MDPATLFQWQSKDAIKAACAAANRSLGEAETIRRVTYKLKR